MNAALIEQAMEKIGNANTLINMVSRRVRQLTSGGGGISRPLVADTANLGMADVALREIIEGKIGWEAPKDLEPPRLVIQKRGRKPGNKALRASLPPSTHAVAA